MAKLKESDLFAPVKKFLIENGCSNVYGEVLGCDALNKEALLFQQIF
ncbi:hypothetical protein [Bacillus sp. GL1(2024)]|nr:hypothetical protein [Bacillus wiedmannii]